MFYLVASIFGVLVIWSAGLWFLFRQYYDRFYEDVTESYTRAMQRLEDRDVLDTRESALMSRLEQFRGRLDKLTTATESRQVDLEPVLERLQGLESVLQGLPEQIPEPDLEPLQARLAALEERVQLGPIEKQVASLEEYVSQLPTSIPPVDLDPTNQRLKLIEERLEALSGPGLGGLASSIAAVSGTVTAMRLPDLGAVEQRLGALEQQLTLVPKVTPEPVDLAPVARRLAALEERLEMISGSSLSAIKGELTAISSTVAGLRVPDLSLVEQRLNTLVGRVDALPTPRDVDVAPLTQGINALRADLKVMSESAATPDLEPVVLRLQALEQRMERLPTDIDAPLRSLHGTLDARLSGIEGRVSQEIDFGPWADRWLAMEARIAELASWDLKAMDRKLAAVSSLIAAWGSPDLTPIEQHLTRIEARMGRLRSEGWVDAPTPAPAQTRVVTPPPPPKVVTTVTPPPPPVERTVEPPSPKVTLKVVEQPKPAPQAKPSSDDPLEGVRRPGGGQNLLRFAAFGTPDDLKRISGVGPKLEAMLHDIGVYYFWQISRWSDEDVSYVDSLLEAFKGRIERDEWVLQALELSSEPAAAEPPGV